MKKLSQENKNFYFLNENANFYFPMLLKMYFVKIVPKILLLKNGIDFFLQSRKQLFFRDKFFFFFGTLRILKVEHKYYIIFNLDLFKIKFQISDKTAKKLIKIFFIRQSACKFCKLKKKKKLCHSDDNANGIPDGFPLNLGISIFLCYKIQNRYY